MISHLLCYLKHTLFKARKPWIFKIFSLRPTLNVMPWISETSEIKSITESFWGHRTDLIIYTHFGSNQPPVYLEISTAFLTRETSAIIPKKLLKKELTYSSNTSYGSFYAHFCCRKGISCYHSNERIIAEPFRWLLFTIKQPAMLNCRRKSIWDSFLIIFLSSNLLVKESEFLPWHFLRTFTIACVLLLVFVPALSGISGNLEQKTILQTTKHIIQYTVLEIQFRSLNYTTVIRICKNLSNFPFLPSNNKARTVCRCKQPFSNSFQTLQTVYTYSNCPVDQLL